MRIMSNQELAATSPLSSAAWMELSRPRPPTRMMGALRCFASTFHGAWRFHSTSFIQHIWRVEKFENKSDEKLTWISEIQGSASSRTFLTFEIRSYQFERTTMASKGSLRASLFHGLLKKLNISWAFCNSELLGFGLRHGSSPKHWSKVEVFLDLRFF